MTLFIPLGKDSQWHNNELRYALRSWETYGSISRLIVAGAAPDWLTGAEIIDWPHLYCKTEDIFRKAQAAASVVDQFIFANDDHFLLQPLTYLPNYYSGSIATHKGGSDRFMDYVRLTHRLFPDGLFFDIHTPMIMDRRLLSLTYNGAVLLKSLFGNSFPGESAQMNDPIIREHMRTSDIESFVTGKPFFAVNDNGLSNDMKRWLADRYPTPSRWEKS